MFNSLYLFIFIGIGVSLLSFLFAFWLYNWVKKQPSDNKKIAEVAKYIQQGARTFLRKE